VKPRPVRREVAQAAAITGAARERRTGRLREIVGTCVGAAIWFGMPAVWLGAYLGFRALGLSELWAALLAWPVFFLVAPMLLFLGRKVMGLPP
jgi:hypothetical protein